jgi:hypothetical protein
LIGWYNLTDDGRRTVLVSFEHLREVPWQLVDHLLMQFPSTIALSDDGTRDWETRDLEKWSDVLKAHRGDVSILRAGATYLTRYDKRSFGLFDALRDREDAIAFSQALADVHERISQAMAQRKATSGQ